VNLSERRIYTVSQLTLLIKSHLEEEFSDVWLEGEISNFRAPNSGHLYFTLKDASTQIRAVFFRSAARTLRFLPKDGLQVICRGRVTVYEPRGEYQMVLDYMEPKGVGALQLAFEQLKEKLLKEGLFDEARKKPIPVLPRKVGVVTSPTGAALRDILNVVRRRFANLDILVAPAAVQGERAVPEIIEGIQDLNLREDIDVIILARGGGGIEDLWAFNDEAVARAIAASRIPIISAIGHEIDFTIADFVADLRAPTPSAAAERVIQSKEEFQRHLESLHRRVYQTMVSRLNLLKTKLASWKRALPKPLLDVQRSIQRLDDLNLRFRQAMVRCFREQKGQLESLLRHLLLFNPSYRIQDQKRRLEELSQSLGRGLRHGLRFRKTHMEGLFSRLHTLSPLGVLGRGYSITLKLPELSVVRTSKDVQIGDQVQVKLQEGVLSCRVEKKGD
jgi:exodeoxyribonuclease VII large subunit